MRYLKYVLYTNIGLVDCIVGLEVGFLLGRHKVKPTVMTMVKVDSLNFQMLTLRIK